MRSNRPESAIENWVTALNTRGSQTRARVEAAVHPDIRVVRFGFGANTGRAVEEIRGVTGVAEWFATTPDVIEFELVGAVEAQVDEHESEVFSAEYQVVAGDFVNGGVWRFRVHEDGRIVWLEHRPNDIEGAVQEGSYRLDRAMRVAQVVQGVEGGRDSGATGTSTHHHHGHSDCVGLSIGHPHHHGENHQDH